MAVARDDLPAASIEIRCAREWLGLAVGVLVLAGLFSLVVVVGRMPPFDRWVTDPLFFKRGLVVHVNLALVAWFYSFVAALLFLPGGRRAPGRLARHSARIGGLGVLAMLLAAGLRDSQPVLSNYVPMLDHWLFAAGQLVFAAAVMASFVGRRLVPGGERRAPVFGLPEAAETGLRCAALCLLLAGTVFGISWWTLPAGLEVATHYELMMWGVGHVLQLTCSVAMVSVWILLLHSALGRSPLSGPAARILFAAWLVPWLSALLFAGAGAASSGYREGFTALMRWSIFPIVSIFLAFCFRLLHQEWRSGRIDRRALADPRLSGFLVSAGLTLLGFGLGAAIRGSNTMVPAHYHASIGGVTAAFMTLTYLLLGVFGFAIPTPRLRRAAAWQPVVYGVGQMVFAAGFGLAGAYGMSRKSYGAEQATRGLAESIGLAVMGVGGLLAVIGGILFLVLVVAIWRRGRESRDQLEESPGEGSWRYRWAREIQTTSIRSRS